VTVSKEFDGEQSHPLEVEEARLYGFWKSKRRGDEKEKWFQNNYCRNLGGMCYCHNLAGPERWAAKQDGLKKIIVVG
jgi:hypothetical protein